MMGFTPWSALAGGALIGLSAAVMMLALGRIAGISGIAGGLLRPGPGDVLWRAAFLAGLPLGALLADGAGLMPEVVVGTSWSLLALAGLLVGYGTRLGSGCTSGHGVCGLARLSPRSLAAVGIFMAAGVLAASLLRPLVGG
jgi:uncharacterized membrane protein YedE/YeeE